MTGNVVGPMYRPTCDWCEGLPAAEHEEIGLLISQCSQCSMTRSN